MIDLRPVVHLIGLIVAVFGITMAAPLAVDLIYRNRQWETFAVSTVITFLIGACMAFSTRNTVREGLTIRQTFLLTTGVFAILPVFGAIPFVFGKAELSFTDAFFEAMSGLTTTGSTVINGLDDMPKGLLFWRGMLQWLGGVSVIIVAMVFLPLLRVGGMQLFRWDGSDTLGNLLPRAAEVTRWISLIYLGLSVACLFAYLMAGLEWFDAFVYTMTTVATGGFGNHDASFRELGMSAEYTGAAFMFLASIPFIRFYQITGGSFRPMFRDSQIQVFICLIAAIVGMLALWQITVNGEPLERAFRQSLFNGVSILTGSGFVSADYGSWGSFPIVVFFFIGLIGGCAGSTSCSIKVFRYQLMFVALRARVLAIRSPRAVALVRYGGTQVPNDVVRSIMAFFVIFLATLAGATLLLSLTGLDFITSVSGAATALANVGPGLGPVIGPAGDFSELSDFAKWVLAIVMLAGRLELSTFYALLTLTFWRV